MKFVFMTLMTALIGMSAFAMSLSQVDRAAGSAGFEVSKLLEAKAPFSVRKSGKIAKGAKSASFSILAAYPKDEKLVKGAATTPIAQLSLNCNQCASKKLTEAFAFACFEDVESLARDMKIDLPPGIVRQFETLKSPQENWPSKDKKAKGFRFTKTISKCDRHMNAESIRFDFYFN